jgi:hypothetical protein
MKRFWVIGFAMLALVVILAAASKSDDPKPQYAKNGHLLAPGNFREWVFLSSGLGMNYSPAAGSEPQFTNVFVPQWAYREFLKGGKWPDKTIFVVEERASQTKGSINKLGHFQTDLAGYAVEVKDSSQPDLWSYYGFEETSKEAAVNPRPGCWQCHEDHAAVEHSFVQFYPTLKPVAKQFGTYKAEKEKVE